SDAGRPGLERRGEPVGRIVAGEFPALVEPVPGAARLAQQQAVRKGVADDTPAILPGLDAQSCREKRAQRVVARSDGLCRALVLGFRSSVHTLRTRRPDQALQETSFLPSFAGEVRLKLFRRCFGSLSQRLRRVGAGPTRLPALLARFRAIWRSMVRQNRT